MRMKKVYDQSKLVRNTPDASGALPDPTKPDGVVLQALPGAVTAVRIQHAGPVQKFTPALLDGGKAEGWLSMDGSTVTLHSEDGPVLYVIDRPPGTYCCFCNQPCRSSPDAQVHVEREHTLPSPDPQNPHGYRRDNFYLCTKKE